MSAYLVRRCVGKAVSQVPKSLMTERWGQWEEPGEMASMRRTSD